MGQKTIAKGRPKPVKVVATNVTAYIATSGTKYCFAKTRWGQVFINKKNPRYAHLRQGDKVQLNIWEFSDRDLYGFEVTLISRRKGYLKITIQELKMLLEAERLLKKSKAIQL